MTLSRFESLTGVLLRDLAYSAVYLLELARENRARALRGLEPLRPLLSRHHEVMARVEEELLELPGLPASDVDDVVAELETMERLAGVEDLVLLASVIEDPQWSSRIREQIEEEVALLEMEPERYSAASAPAALALAELPAGDPATELWTLAASAATRAATPVEPLRVDREALLERCWNES